jgi:dolichol-phosphate mannosyltransferase
MDIQTIASEGYCFQIEMTRRALARGGTIAEVPITFIEREHGVSKMSFGIALEAVLRITAWGFLRIIGR